MLSGFQDSQTHHFCSLVFLLALKGLMKFHTLVCWIPWDVTQPPPNPIGFPTLQGHWPASTDASNRRIQLNHGESHHVISYGFWIYYSPENQHGTRKSAFEKETHLPNLHFWGSMLVFGVGSWIICNYHVSPCFTNLKYGHFERHHSETTNLWILPWWFRSPEATHGKHTSTCDSGHHSLVFKHVKNRKEPILVHFKALPGMITFRQASPCCDEALTSAKHRSMSSILKPVRLSSLGLLPKSGVSQSNWPPIDRGDFQWFPHPQVLLITTKPRLIYRTWDRKCKLMANL